MTFPRLQPVLFAQPSLAGDLEHCAELEDPWNARGLFEARLGMSIDMLMLAHGRFEFMIVAKLVIE